MRSTLEVLHSKVRELGGRKVRGLFSSMHSGSFNSILAGVKEITPEVDAKIRGVWPEDFKEPDVTGFPAEPGVNQFNFTICSPVRNSYDPSTVSSILGLVRRTGCGWLQRPFDSMIARSRNLLASAFLRSDSEWSFWIDDDVIVPNGNAGWFREQLPAGVALSDEYLGQIAPYQLASWGKTIVSGVYYSRHGVAQITAGFNPGTSLTNPIPHRQLLPVRYTGFGCIMVHRKVFEDIVAKHPELWPDKGSECQVFSPWATEDGRMPGEDEALCLRAKEVGHDVFLDLSVVAAHVGRSVNWIPSNGNKP